jgi:hypothetical protein
MEFLDVPTLVSIGSTNKKNQEHLSEKVARRKSRFKAIQNKINKRAFVGRQPCALSRAGASGSSSSSRSLSIDRYG